MTAVLSSIWYIRVNVVVCFPEFSTVEISRVAISAPGTSRLTMVDLPIPDCPIRMVDRFSIIGNKVESVSSGFAVAETSWTA